MVVIAKEKARSSLPGISLKDFDDIVEQRVLGASAHIHMIGNMIEAIALCYEEGGDLLEMRNRIHTICDYFIATRGEASQAFANAIYQMTKGLDQNSKNDDRMHGIKEIIRMKNEYVDWNRKSVDKAVDYAVEIGERMEKILVFDYSSTVEKFLLKLTQGKTIIIAESRVINGGMPFVSPCLERGHKVKFIADAALMYFIKDCDGVFMGAESIYPDGTGFNTTGSDIVGLLCDYYKKPLYFISPLIKLDSRPVYGKEKKNVLIDLKEKMLPTVGAIDTNGTIDYISPELIGVCPKHIKGYITERGVIPSEQLYMVAMQYLKELRGDENV